VFVRLGGAVLRGRYGGGGSVRLSLSENWFGGLRWFAEVMEIISEVSMPVKYAPFAPDGIGPRIIGCGAAGFAGRRY
jgi:hypothetical protein